MLFYLANVVASGAKTSSGFKKVHLNTCAKEINEKFNKKFTGDQVKNHLKTWQKKFQKLNRLRKISASGWDETNFIITLDEEHYDLYFGHLVANPHIGRAFYRIHFAFKLTWISLFVSERFPGH
ncbi:hypothetical protein U9M48_024765 [Paspalum notatum var. saurae]|uniref:Myb/SANT-like domain-containing protein n=1 Tax=Paspalum notatum var. saurae TaxID=547442 RepID=A0AAQ3WXB7_PASNO